MVKKLYIYPPIIIVLFIILLFLFFVNKKDVTTIEIGLYSGTISDVPSLQSNKIIDDAIKRFETANPGIRIKYKPGIMKSDYSEWISKRILKGSPPDLFFVLKDDFSTFSSLNIFQNIGEMSARDTEFYPSAIYQNALLSGTFKGALYALPLEVDPIILFVNTTILNKEGISIPHNEWTWDDFYKICSVVTKDTNNDGTLDQFGMIDFDWESAVYTNGQTLFSENSKSAEFNKPEVIDAVKFIKSLNQLNKGYKVSNDDFDSGRVVFKPFPFSWYRIYKSYPYKLIRYSDFEWKCIMLPRGPKGKNASQLNTSLIGISSKSSKKNEAWRFLRFLVSDPETQFNVFRYSSGVPVLKTVVNSFQADTELNKYSPNEVASIDKKILGLTIENSIVTTGFHNKNTIMKLADSVITKLAESNDWRDIELELDNLNREINGILETK